MRNMTPHTITVWSREDVTEDAARRKEILKEGHDKPLLEIPSTGVANCRPRREKCGDALGVPVYRETFTPADVDPVPGDGPTNPRSRLRWVGYFLRRGALAGGGVPSGMDGWAMTRWGRMQRGHMTGSPRGVFWTRPQPGQFEGRSESR